MDGRDDAKMQEHEKRISSLEDSQIKLHREIKNVQGDVSKIQDGQRQVQSDLSKVQTSQAELQLTVIKENQTTRKSQERMSDLLENMINKQFEINRIEAEGEQKYKVTKLSTREKIILGVVGGLGGTGGILAGVATVIQILK